MNRRCRLQRTTVALGYTQLRQRHFLHASRRKRSMVDFCDTRPVASKGFRDT